MTEILVKLKAQDIVAEYNKKLENIENAIKDFTNAGDKLKQQSCIGGVYGTVSIDTGNISKKAIILSLKRSAWLYFYEKYNFDKILSANDKKLLEQSLVNPPEFTVENIMGTFGEHLINSRYHILRGMAEVFCGLDPFYKSHDKMRIGAKGLPKRVIISGMTNYSQHADNKIKDILNALAIYQGKPLVDHIEIIKLKEDENGLIATWSGANCKGGESIYPPRGVWLRRFSNGNGHLFFDKETLRDVNMALAEYYGEVLPDCPEERPEKRRESTDVAKDLQYYPTPVNVVKSVLSNVYFKKGEKVLEPSCGCGRFLDEIARKGADVFGIEVDYSRAEIARNKGHKVMLGNFLETIPTGDYDKVIMNPPFYGTHYVKHINHAIKFLKPGGMLIAILPVTARYDHGLVNGIWNDLPVGSFRESGTNINTTVLNIIKN